MMGKLTDEQVQAIRSAPIGTKPSDLAKEFGVSRSSITRIRQGLQQRRLAAGEARSETIPPGKNLVEKLANSIDGTAEVIRRTVEKMLNSPDPTAVARLLGTVTRAQADMTTALANLKDPRMLSWLTKAELKDMAKQVFEEPEKETH
jgi:hypothetical protein